LESFRKSCIRHVASILAVVRKFGMPNLDLFYDVENYASET